MRTFSSLGAFAVFCGSLVLEADVHKRKLLDEAAKIVQDEAKRVLGTYDYGWPPLAPSTVERKGGDTPGIETEEMKESIQRKVINHDEALVGSELDRALWFELGTVKQPPRSFLVGAARQKEAEIVHRTGAHFVRLTFRA
jgi:hypothetical protein